jgi:hypothetical protein
VMKQGPIGNTLEEHIENRWGTEGNMLGTKEKWKKNQGTLSAC